MKSRSKIVIFASSREDGNTKKALQFILNGIDYTLISLNHLEISPFDYQHKNKNDDFIPLIEKIIDYDDVILATPIYWYSPCAQMKTFIDRFSDLLTIRKDLGQKLEGKNVFVICSYGSEYHLGSCAFETPIRLSCEYMNMNYIDCFYSYSEKVILENDLPLIEFRKKLNHELPSNKIPGNTISLRMATLSDRKQLYEWMYLSDASKSMWGAPLFPEKPIKDWDDFKSSWQAFYYQMPLTSLGHVFVIEKDAEDIGGIAFHRPDSKNRSEIDIWLRSENDCGKGSGKDAINTLCHHLHRQFGIKFFWVMPSKRNPRSCAAFEKLGFRRLPLTPQEGQHEFGFQDYFDSVYLIRDMSLS